MATKKGNRPLTDGLNNARSKVNDNDVNNGSDIEDDDDTAQVHATPTIRWGSSKNNVYESSIAPTGEVDEFIKLGEKVLARDQTKVRSLILINSTCGIQYTTIIVTRKGINGGVYYAMIVLEETGERQSLPTNVMVEGFDRRERQFTLVTAESVDEGVSELAEQSIQAEYGAEIELIGLGSIVITTGTDHKYTAPRAYSIVSNAMAFASTNDAGIASDINMDDIESRLLKEVTRKGKIEKVSNDMIINIDLSYGTANSINALGRHTYSNFLIETAYVAGKGKRGFDDNKFNELNNADSGKIVETRGYLEFDMMTVSGNYRDEAIKKAGPIVIITNNLGNFSSLAFELLGIYSATRFADDKDHRNLIDLIIERDAGALNYFFNYGGEGKVGDKISFKDSNANPETVDDIIYKHFFMEPDIAVEFEIGGPAQLSGTPFLHLTNCDDETMDISNRTICNAVNDLFDGDMDENILFSVDDGIVVPLGEFIDSDGVVRDIREIDLVFILENTGDAHTSLVYDWVASNMSTNECINITGEEPFVVRVRVLNALANILGIEIIIKGKANRVKINDEWMDEFVSIAHAAGYKPRANDDRNRTMTSGLRKISSEYNRRGISVKGGARSNDKRRFTKQTYVRQNRGRR